MVREMIAIYAVVDLRHTAVSAAPRAGVLNCSKETKFYHSNTIEVAAPGSTGQCQS